MADAAVDQFARDGMHLALAKIDAHEKVCEAHAQEARTWREGAAATMARIEVMASARADKQDKAIIGAYNRMWALAVSSIALLVAAIGFLIVNHGLGR